MCAGCASLFTRAGEDFAEGMVADLSRDDRVGQVEAVVRRVLLGLADGLEEDLGPELQAQVARLVAAALSEAASADRQEELAGLAERLTVAVTSATSDQIGEGLRTDVGPAIATVIERDVVPAMSRSFEERMSPGLARAMSEHLAPATAEAMDADISPALARLARGVVREVTDEMAQQLAEDGGLEAAFRYQRRATLEEVDGMVAGRVDEATDAARAVVDRTFALASLAIGVLGALLLGALSLWFRQRRQSQAFEAALEVVTSNIRQAATEQRDVVTMVDTLRKTDRGTSGARALDAFLNDRPHLKVDKRG
jgi:hypothetical protein